MEARYGERIPAGTRCEIRQEALARGDENVRRGGQRKGSVNGGTVALGKELLSA